MSKYKYTKAMREISGFGGDYEKACQHMVIVGMEWLDEHPEAQPVFSQRKNLYGIINEENDYAKELSMVVAEAEPDCTGAMHQTTINHIMYAHKVGWETYVEEMSKELSE